MVIKPRLRQQLIALSAKPTPEPDKPMNKAQQSPLWAPTIRSAGRTDRGKVRLVNEDRLLARPEAGLWAVADGMGGHQAGDYAAQRLIDALATLATHQSAFSYLNATLDAINAVNAMLFAESSTNPVRRGMGTTFVVLLAYDAHLACVWAGDSRAYRWRNGQLEQLTTDHSLVQELIDRGDIGTHERQLHPKAHVITKAVGVFRELEVDKTFSMISPGDKFLICSDGLSNSVSDVVLAESLSGLTDISHQADLIMQKAMETDALDNISFILLHA